MDSHRESRKRLRPWLERMIEAKTCPGLVWENKEERSFRIPWRHFNNKDWDAKDSQVFMEWAKFTGKYHDGDKLEYPVWKTRLRCALKKIQEIRELSEQHNLDGDNPYRVYKFVDVPVMKRVSDFDSDYSASPGSTSFYTNSPNVLDFLEETQTSPPPKYFNETFRSPKSTSNVPTVVYDEDSSNYNNLTVKTENAVYLDHPVGMLSETMNHHPNLHNQHFGNGYPALTNFNISSQPDFFDGMSSSSQNYSAFTSTSQAELHLLEHETSEGAVAQHLSMKESLPSDLMSVESSDLCKFGSSGVPSLGPSSFHVADGVRNDQNVMQIILKYGFPHSFIFQKNIDAKGCRLYFGAPQLQYTLMDETLFGPKTVDQIEIPDVKNIHEICDEQKGFISELLDSMERGLVLTYKDGDIYAQRLCRTRVFVSDGVAESRLLNRKEDTPIKVFDFAAFKASIQNSVMPKHFFYLTFGQEIKKNRSEPMGRVLIHAQIIHTEASKYASKLLTADNRYSLELFSSFNTNDKMLQRFKNMTIKQ